MAQSTVYLGSHRVVGLYVYCQDNTGYTPEEMASWLADADLTKRAFYRLPNTLEGGPTEFFDTLAAVNHVTGYLGRPLDYVIELDGGAFVPYDGEKIAAFINP